MARQSDHLAEEMSRFEQEILGGSGASVGGAPRPSIQPLLPRIPSQARPPGPPPGMPPGPRPGPPQSMPPGPPPGMPPGPPRGMPPGVRPFHGRPPDPPHHGGFRGLPPRPLLDSPHSRPPLGLPPGPPHGGMPPGPPPGSMPPGLPPRHMPPGPPPGNMPRGPPPGSMPPGPPPGGMHPGQAFRPPPPNSAPLPMGGPPPKGHPTGATIQQPSIPLLPQPPPTAPVPGLSNTAATVSSVAKPTPPSVIPPMVPAAVAPRQVAVASMTAQPSLNETVGATAVPSTTKIFPAPTRPLKTKRDPKKLRLAGGQAWQDHSLDDWDQNDFRIFCGDLGNDVNDDALARAFSRFPSFLKAKVIRDKYTKKTKGYGFVSFKDPHDFMQAMREMNGRYIGNRPVKLRKSTWRERCFEVVKKRDKEKKKLGFK